MQLKAHAFPIVRMDYDETGPGGLAEGLATFEALLARREIFVLIGRGASDQSQDHEERKAITLWMKRHREALGQFVLGLIYVAADAADQVGAEAAAVTYEKFWGYPMMVTPSDSEALAMAGCLLAGEPLDGACKTQPRADR